MCLSLIGLWPAPTGLSCSFLLFVYEKCCDSRMSESDTVHKRGNEEAKEFVMSLYDNSMLDEMRKTYENILKTDDRHKKNMRNLRKLCETGLEHLSLEEAFIKFGGDRMQNVPKNDLEEIASQLVDSPEIMLSKETKEKLFRAWEERLNGHHHRHHLSTSPTKLQ
ncbi:uncharacterized protein LOC126162915 isoform X2 [Schistocerca cancellata]|uniref:uncharacterized protein LOC126162915 isoform X2 n=1 Tax=Schistocerca cancellata TaxID=274614 RepID=UPI002119B1D1|nr:uncharacterized protein LOC126162915 isoform X2 [Schistocerca cancellata]